ncbi:reticulocyte-binding protein homolog 2a-like [Bacillus rossius redtenbacheri]|uniref:reticulocyte-binding protein homolog 2a-like n=1 Tax=Bacillus rossius redtenbacheri TaxID=93214 RepID=UPI002FDC870C
MSSGTAASGMLEVSLAPRRSLSPMDAAPDRARHSRRSLTPSGAPRSRSASPYGDLSSKVALFNKHASAHLEAQAVNPFSGDGRTSPRPRLDRSDASYGRPVGKTALRGLKAQSQVSKEILELCEVIAENGESLSDGPGDDDPRTAISFGNLFHIYTYISNKVVGILLRARKQKLLDFEGETLFQKKDDHVPIVMLKSIKDIREHFRAAEQQEKELRKQQERELYLQEHPEVLIEEEMRRAYEQELLEEERAEKEAVDRSKEVVDQSKEVVDQSKEVVDQSKEVVDQSKEVVDQSKEVIDQSKEVVDQPKEVENQPKPPVEFQLVVQVVAEDDSPVGAGEPDSSEISAAQEGKAEEPSSCTGVVGQSQEKERLEAAENKSSCQPVKTSEVARQEEDVKQTALANTEQQKAPEKIC